MPMKERDETVIQTPLVSHMCVCFMQRPNAKELLKHRFIRNAKKNSCLQDLIERYKRWKACGGDSGDELSDNERGSVHCVYVCVWMYLYIPNYGCEWVIIVTFSLPVYT